MKNYRQVLYANYSSAFASENRGYDPEAAHALFALSYPAPALSKETPIADVGCGKGEWLGWLRSLGFNQLQGFDVSAAEVAFEKSIPIECGDVLETLGAPRWVGHFGLIHAKDLVEHLTKDEMVEWLRLSHQALRPGGLLWISTFNAQGLFGMATRYGDFTHENGFTPNSMAQVLRACGFEVRLIEGCHVCPQTLPGFLRKIIWNAVAWPARLVLKARHGGKSPADIDFFSVAPDLIVVARKPSAQGA